MARRCGEFVWLSGIPRDCWAKTGALQAVTRSVLGSRWAVDPRATPLPPLVYLLVDHLARASRPFDLGVRPGSRHLAILVPAG